MLPPQRWGQPYSNTTAKVFIYCCKCKVAVCLFSFTGLDRKLTYCENCPSEMRKTILLKSPKPTFCKTLPLKCYNSP